MSAAPTKLYQRIAETLAARISAGTYPVGSRLPGERDLAAEFDVSRPTIREAMIALDLRGLVEARQKSGIYVTDGSGNRPAADLDVGAFELIEARNLVEGEAAALAAVGIDAAALAELRDLLDAMTSEPDQPEKVDLDRRFHLVIAGATGNSLIRAMVENLWTVRTTSPLCVHMFAQARRNGVAPRADEHRAIVEALAAHNSQAARKAMRAHLKRVTDDLLEATRLEWMQRAEADYDAHRSHVSARTSA